MSERCWRYTPFLLVIVSGFPCRTWSQVFSGANQASKTINLTVLVEGHVSVKRPHWAAYAPVVFGTALQSGDLLRVEQSSRAKVLCSDLTLRDLSPGFGGVPCGDNSRTLLRRRDGSLINATRSWTNDGTFPTVLCPRKTKLLSPLPLLRWTPVQGISEYLVIVRGSNFLWSTRVSSKTEITYPEASPELKPGVDYKLIVETGDRSSSAEPGIGLGFSLLDSNEKREVLKEQKQIEQLGLPNETTQFLIAFIYATHGLNAEAIQRLEAVSKTSKEAAVERFLGDLYLDIALTRLAEAHYLNSLALSTNENDEEGQMQDHFVLARIYEQGLGNRKSAAEHLQATLALAVVLGDDETASKAKKTLGELNRAGT